MSRSSRLVLAILVAAVTSAFVVSPASAATPTCGSILTTSVTFTSDLTCPGPVALYVGADNVTVDLNGYLLRGSGGIGIRGTSTPPASGTVIRNGTITGFNIGVWVFQQGPWLVTNMRLVGNGAGFTAEQTYDWTVQFSTLAHNTVGLNAADVARRGTVRSNHIFGNTDDGIRADYQADGNIYADNYVASNGGYGINIFTATSSVLHNRVYHNAKTGINVVDIAYPIFFPYVIAENISNHNGGYGIFATDPRWDGGGNSASGNALQPQCVNIACS